MSSKITADHLARGAVVYVRQSTMSQVVGNTESKRRQYGLADQARVAGFASVAVIDDDLGRSGSGVAERPGFQKLVTAVCAGEVGAVFCIEASRLARNGRDWHHLVDLCALAATLVIDPDGVYDPRLVNDRLLLGLKGTMSEYELSLLRQRGIEARDGKARRGALQFTLPPGYCWSEDGRIEIDPDERVSGAVRMCSPAIANSAARGSCSSGHARPASPCPWCNATRQSARSPGGRRPTTPSCRSCTIRFTPVPTPLPDAAAGSASRMGVPARRAVTIARWRSGAR